MPNPIDRGTVFQFSENQTATLVWKVLTFTCPNVDYISHMRTNNNTNNNNNNNDDDDDDDDDDFEVAHPQSGSSFTRSLIELEFGKVSYLFIFFYFSVSSSSFLILVLFFLFSFIFLLQLFCKK